MLRGENIESPWNDLNYETMTAIIETVQTLSFSLSHTYDYTLQSNFLRASRIDRKFFFYFILEIITSCYFA